MCGICGELNFTGSSPGLSALDRMIRQLVRRGPDQSGTWSEGPLAFGHRRLTVIDPSFRSHQPMTDHTLGKTIIHGIRGIALPSLSVPCSVRTVRQRIWTGYCVWM